MSYYRLRRGGPTCPPDQQPEDTNIASGGHIGPPEQGTMSEGRGGPTCPPEDKPEPKQTAPPDDHPTTPPEEWPRRKFIRLKGYDYSQPGYYFVTICVQHKECLFGTIRDGKPVLNEVGRMIEQWYYRMEEKFANLRCDAMVVMPNHFHCLFEIRRGGHMASGGQGDAAEDTSIASGGHMGPPVQDPLPERRYDVPGVVRWFKTMTTNEYIRMVKAGRAQPFDRRLWQRNYWEHIARDRQDYDNIRNYIVTNPLRWHEDSLHTKE